MPDAPVTVGSAVRSHKARSPRTASIALACAATLCNGIAWAAADTGALQAALTHLPQSVFIDPNAGPARFVDLDVASQVSGQPPGRDSLSRVSLGQGIAPVMALAAGDNATWQEHTGLAPTQLAYVAGFGLPPAEFSVWGLRSEADVQALLERLPAHAFTHSRGVFANGPDNGMDIPSRDPRNPWRGPMGRTAAVAVDGTTVYQGSAAAGVRALRGQRESAASGPAAIAAASVQASTGAVVQALMFGPALGLAPTVDPARLLGKTPAQAREALTAAVGQVPTGVPPYGAAIVADVQTEGRPRLAIALAYDDCAQAEAAATTMVALWQADAEDAGTQAAAFLPATAQAHPAATGCAALLFVDAKPAADDTRNAAFEYALNRFHRRALSVTRIGATP